MIVFAVLNNGTFLSGDCHFGGDGVDKGVFIHRVQEAVQVFAFVPDDFCCGSVDYDGEQYGNPVMLGDIEKSKQCKAYQTMAYKNTKRRKSHSILTQHQMMAGPYTGPRALVLMKINTNAGTNDKP